MKKISQKFAEYIGVKKIVKIGNFYTQFWGNWKNLLITNIKIYEKLETNINVFHVKIWVLGAGENENKP